MKSILKLATPYIQQSKWRVLLLVLLSVLAGLLSIAVPYITGSFIDFLISPTAKEENLAVYCFIFLFVSLISLVINYASNMVKAKCSLSMSYKLNRDIIEHIHKSPFNLIRNLNVASLTQRVNYDSNQIITYTLGLLCNITINAMTFVVPFALLVYISPLASILVAVFATLYVVAYLYMKKKLYRSGYSYKEVQADFFGHLNDQVRFFKFIKDNSIVYLMLQRLDAAFVELFSKAVVFQRIGYIFGSLDSLIVTFSQIALFALGGGLVISEKISVGEFTIMNSYISIILTSIRFFFGLGRDTQNTMISYDRITKLLAVKAENEGPLSLGDPLSISLTSLCCTIGKETIFSDLNYEFKRGTMYAITGPNGCGKTTLANALLGECREYLNGSILFNEVTCSSLDMSYERRSTIGFCEQEPVLFDDTVQFNLTLENSVKENTLKKVLCMLGVSSAIQQLPDGMQTRLTSSSGLSGGEKQKIAIARVLYKDRPIMIFDEPTSAMDKASKHRFIEYLARSKTEKIIIVITHDQDLLPFFDEVLTMESRCD